MIDPDKAFDAAMRRRMPHTQMRPETPEDTDFLVALFGACSPMAGVIPEQMLVQQAELANRGFRASHPDAMRRIAVIDEQPVGRIMVDWQDTANSHGIDVAVAPEARKTGVGLFMLQSWLDVADQLGRSCTLEVVATNPARKIYQRLGFVVSADMDESYAVLDMRREPRSAPQG